MSAHFGLFITKSFVSCVNTTANNVERIKTFKEYLIYGVTDVIGFVGGTLGLFIGFSFLDSVMRIVNTFKNISFWYNSQSM